MHIWSWLESLVVGIRWNQSRRSSHKSQRRPAMFRSGVEQLEHRTMLSAPTISVSVAAVGDPGVFIISGSVQDESPAGLVVQIAGPEGARWTATVGEDGTYSVSVVITTSGTIGASTTDADGLASNTAYAYVDLG